MNRKLVNENSKIPMKNRLLIVMFVISTAIFNCKENRKFIEVKNLSAFDNTLFIPTLEQKILLNGTC